MSHKDKISYFIFCVAVALVLHPQPKLSAVRAGGVELYQAPPALMAASTASNDALRTLMLRLLFRRLTAEPAPAPSPVSSESDRQVRQATAEERQAGAICRVCFEAGSGVLITPCACTGTQQWIHVHCLRQWQRSLLGQRDAGHRASRCSVCTQLFALPPPPLPAAPVQVGTLLVAVSVLGGSFKQAVVLICHADEHGVHGLLLTSPVTHRPCTPPDPSGPEVQARRALASLNPGVAAEWRRGGPVCGGRLGMTMLTRNPRRPYSLKLLPSVQLILTMVCGGRLGVTTYSALHNIPVAPGSFLVVGRPTAAPASTAASALAPAPAATTSSSAASTDAADAAIARAAEAAETAGATADSVSAAAAGGGAAAAGGSAAAMGGGAAEAAAAAEGIWYAVGRRGGGNSELVG